MSAFPDTPKTLLSRMAAQVRAADRQVSFDNDDFPMEVAVPSETAAVIDVKWRQARRAAVIEHVLAKTALAQQSKDIYRAYALGERSDLPGGRVKIFSKAHCHSPSASLYLLLATGCPEEKQGKCTEWRRGAKPEHGRSR